MHSYLPTIVELHNYSAANSVTQKEYNWATLNDKVFRKFGFRLSKDDIGQIVRARPGAIERVLLNLEVKLEAAKRNGIGKSRGSSGTGRRSQRGSSKGQAGRGGRRNLGGRNQQQQQQQSSASKFNERRTHGAPRMQVQPVQQQRRTQQEPQWNTNNIPPQTQMHPDNMQREVDQEILLEKEQEVQELRKQLM